MNELNLKPEHALILFEVFKKYCPKAEIWAYGSRVKCGHNGSDLDLTVIDFGEDDKSILQLRKLVRESDIPFLVDLTMFNDLPISFQNEIKKGYVIFFTTNNVLVVAMKVSPRRHFVLEVSVDSFNLIRFCSLLYVASF